MPEVAEAKRDYRWPDNAEIVKQGLCLITGKRRWLFEAGDAEELGLTFLVCADALKLLRVAPKKERAALIKLALTVVDPKDGSVKVQKPKPVVKDLPVEIVAKAVGKGLAVDKPAKKSRKGAAKKLMEELNAEVEADMAVAAGIRAGIAKSRKARAVKEDRKADVLYGKFN